jgi:hypothetical protein
MSDEREHDPPVDEAPEEKEPGRIQSVEWTTSTYRSSRKATDVPRKGAKTKAHSRPAPDAPEDDD